MKNGKTPDPDTVHPIPGYDKEIYVRPTLKNPQISVGEFTYIADSDFESHVTHLYPWNGDRLVIGNDVWIRHRFDGELTDMLLRFRWWDRSVGEINELIPLLTSGDPDKVKAEIGKRLSEP